MEKIPIGEIKRKLNVVPITEIPTALECYRQDERQGVKKLVEAFEKKFAAYEQELKRLEEISFFEKKYFAEGFQMIAGVDEVGRGPLAGPVVAGVVILERQCKIPGINDSKKLSAAKREELFEIIQEKAIDYAIGTVSSQVIDEMNILQATYEAMRQAIGKLKIKPDFILADAVTIPKISIKQTGILQGDAKSISIGAASILAKVTRDRMMMEMDQLYPGYGFAKNKGYGSTEHINAIKEKGICAIHRQTFVKNFLPQEKPK